MYNANTSSNYDPIHYQLNSNSLIDYSPEPQPEPQPERLPTPPPSPAVKPEQRTAVQILQRERLKKGLSPVDPEQIVAGGDVDSPRTRGEVARVVENLKRQKRNDNKRNFI